MKCIKKHVLFYSSVRDKELFNIQQFYRIDIQILEELGYNVLLSNKISDAWKFWRYDIVFAYFYRYSFYVALIAKLFGKKTYFTGGIDSLDKQLVSNKDYIIQKLFFKLCYSISKSCIIVSRTDEKNVRSIVGGRKLYYSEHSIDTSKFECNILDKENICTTIAWQGTKENVERKGVDKAIMLFAKLHQLPLFQNYTLYIIGKKGEGTLYLNDIIDKLKIRDSVKFTDSISEKEKINYLKHSKIYFQLSKYEGFGVAALEALCSNNIVVHSGRGGLSNPIYKNGIFVDIDHSVDQMFRVMEIALNEFDNRSLENARDIVCRNYDNERRKMDFYKIMNEFY